MIDSASKPPGLDGLVRRFGSHTLTYALYQPGLTFFGDAQQGYIAFRKCIGVAVALGDPLCPPEATPDLVRAFLNTHDRVFFAQITQKSASILRHLGLRLTPLGVDTELSVPNFSLAGGQHQDLRHYRNRARHAGVRVREMVDSAPLRDLARTISKAWLATKHVSSHELEFLIRPLSPDPEPGVRIFTAIRNGRTIAYVIFDPMFRDGAPEGYVASILRSYPEVPEGTLDCVILHALETFRDEGLSRLSLGVSPLSGLDDVARVEGKGASPLFWACRTLYRQRWQPILNVRALSFHKSRYRGQEWPVFGASRSPVGLWDMVALLRACKIR
jgi:lysylphosphatidylglycerol synthetase-like protein (DUF2156 family)